MEIVFLLLVRQILASFPYQLAHVILLRSSDHILEHLTVLFLVAVKSTSDISESSALPKHCFWTAAQMDRSP